MTKNKTKPTEIRPNEFINAIENERRREDAFRLLSLYEELIQMPPRMWGTSIIGFGDYQYQQANGSWQTWMRAGFSPRKQSLSVYLMTGMENDGKPDLLTRLGKHKTGRSCLYINRLSDIRVDMLKQLIMLDFYAMNARYPN